VIVTVDGTPVAQLGPIEPVGAPGLDDLVAAGLVNVPRVPRSVSQVALESPIEVAVDAGADRVVDEVRGR
jgi:hypothetical protein